MSVEYINFIYTQQIFQEEKNLLETLFKNLEKSKKRYVVINSTWLDDKRLKKCLKNKKFDALVVCSLMDTPHLNLDFLNNFPIHKVGYYKNSPYYFDLHSFMVSKYLKVDPTAIDDSKISIPFMSLNGKPHQHRIEFVKSLIKSKLNEKNLISFNSVETRGLVLKLDKFKTQHITPSPFDVYTLGNLENWNKHFLNIVTETVYNTEDIFFITEKTYKPILGYKPFFVYSKNGSINMLKHFGFEPYNSDFTDISDLDLSTTKNYIEFLKILSSQDEGYFQQKHKSLKEKILYNRNNFYTHLNKQLDSLKEFSNFNF